MINRVFALAGVDSSGTDVFGVGDAVTEINNLGDMDVRQAAGVAMAVEHPKWPQARRVLGLTGYHRPHEEVVKSVVAAGASRVHVAWAGEMARAVTNPRAYRMNDTSDLVKDHKAQGGRNIEGVWVSFTHDIGALALARFLPGLRDESTPESGVLASSLGVFVYLPDAFQGGHLDQVSGMDFFNIPLIADTDTDLNGLRFSSGRTVLILDFCIRILEGAAKQRGELTLGSRGLILFTVRQIEFFKILGLIFCDMIEAGYVTPELHSAVAIFEEGCEQARALDPEELEKIAEVIRAYQKNIIESQSRQPQIDLLLLGAVA